MSDGTLVRTTAGLLDPAELGYGPEGPHAFSARAHTEGARAQLLARRASYFTARHHDHKAYSWDNHMLPGFAPGHTPLLSMGIAELPFYAPLYQRRPCAPYRLPRMVVKSFTALLFGEGRFPRVEVPGDEEAEDFANALVEAAEIPEKLEAARDMGGACGTAALSWRFWQGEPRVQAHLGADVEVQRWADRERLVPAVATEILQYERQEWDPKAKALAPVRYWRRRDWTEQADVAFVDLKVGSKEEQEVGWVVDIEETCVHGEGEAHLVWIPNGLDLDAASEDGVPDFEGLQEDAETLDVVLSVLAYGGAKNLDPTLLLKMDPDVVRRAGTVRKGSDNAIALGSDGDASFLELAGQSIAAGETLVKLLRQVILETAQVVPHDPERLSAATNASALKLLYAPMLFVGNGLRGRYGRGLKRLLDQMMRSARRHLGPPPESRLSDPGVSEEVGAPPEDASEAVVVEDDPPAGISAEQPAQAFLALPPRLVEEDALDADGQPVPGKKVRREVERTPGRGGEIKLVWPDWFPPTPADRQAEIATLSTANGGKALLPRELATRRAAEVLGLDPDEAWRLMGPQVEAEREAEAGMFPNAGLPPEPGAPPQGTEQAEPPGTAP